ncbi:MAG: glycosyl transferase, partial [Solimonas sp.]
FGVIALVLAALSLLLVEPIVAEYLRTGLVPRFPTAVLCTGIMLTAVVALTCGVVLESVKRGQREIKRLLYLRQP